MGFLEMSNVTLLPCVFKWKILWAKNSGLKKVLSSFHTEEDKIQMTVE